MDSIEKELTEPIPPQCISVRQGLSYVTGRYVKQRLNELFGWSGWSYEIIRFDPANAVEGRAFCHLRLMVSVDQGVDE